jgi:chromosome segregation ATPase
VLTSPISPPTSQLEVNTGLDEYRKRAEAAEALLTKLEEDNARLQRDNERLRDQVDAMGERAAQSDIELREERMARLEATESLARVKSNVERAEDSLARERQRSADATTAGARAVKDRQTHGAELEKYAGENAELRDEIRVLHEDLLAYREAVAELKGDLEDAGEERAEAEATVREAAVEVARLQAELVETAAAVEHSQA